MLSQNQIKFAINVVYYKRYFILVYINLNYHGSHIMLFITD